jgi:hypothetical protein
MTATTLSGGAESTFGPVEAGRTTNNSTPLARSCYDLQAHTMTLKRTATIVVVGAVLAAWLAGAATSKRMIPPPIVTTPQAIDARGADLTNEIARLRDRLRPTAVPVQPRRNLFTFRSNSSNPIPLPAPATPSIPLEQAAPRPSEPPLKLAGIAEDGDPQTPERTAIISGAGQLFMVKVGDSVTPRYRVARISSDGVELSDMTNPGIVRRLIMR